MIQLRVAVVLSAVVAGLPVAARAQQAGLNDHEDLPSETQPSERVGVLRQLGRDFRHLVDRDNLKVLAWGGAASLAVHSHDRELTDDVRDSQALDGALEIGTVGGGGYVQAGGAVGTYLIGCITHKAEVRSLGSDLVRAQIVTGVVTQALKLATQRTRPDGSNPYSFPSGHASATFATATVLERHFGWKVGAPAFAFAAYVAASRMQEYKHFASDVIMGATIGIMGGRSVTFGRGSKHVTLAPLAIPGGGVGLAVVGVSR